MSGRLAGKCAIVTGAASGIGRATAILFAAEGCSVALFDINQEDAEATVNDIQSYDGKAHFFFTDMTSAQNVKDSVHAVVNTFGRLDILVNVAGGSGRRWGDGPVDICSEDGWDRTIELNLKSMFLGCKYAVREMLKSGGGSIVNLSSVLGMVGGGEDFSTHAYAASKGGVISLTRAMATTYAVEHIRANVISPGLITTTMSRRAQTDPNISSRLAELQPLTGAFGRPEDVAQAALYLASDESSFVTGAVLTVDGGWTAK